MPSISNARRLAINIRDEFKCSYCYKDLRRATPDQITLDHLVPQSIGGGHSTTNLATCCFPCNRKKSVTNWKVFAKEHYPAAVRRISYRIRRKLNMPLAEQLIAGYGNTEKARKAVVRKGAGR